MSGGGGAEQLDGAADFCREQRRRPGSRASKRSKRTTFEGDDTSPCTQTRQRIASSVPTSCGDSSFSCRRISNGHSLSYTTRNPSF